MGTGTKTKMKTFNKLKTIFISITISGTKYYQSSKHGTSFKLSLTI